MSPPITPNTKPTRPEPITFAPMTGQRVGVARNVPASVRWRCSFVIVVAPSTKASTPAIDPV